MNTRAALPWKATLPPGSLPHLPPPPPTLTLQEAGLFDQFSLNMGWCRRLATTPLNQPRGLQAGRVVLEPGLDAGRHAQPGQPSPRLCQRQAEQQGVPHHTHIVSNCFICYFTRFDHCSMCPSVSERGGGVHLRNMHAALHFASHAAAWPVASSNTLDAAHSIQIRS